MPELEEVSLEQAFAEEQAAPKKAKKSKKTAMSAADQLQADEDAAREKELLAQKEAEKAAKVSELTAELLTAQAAVKSLQEQLREVRGHAASNRGPAGVGAFIKEKITEGLTNQEIIDEVAAKFPENFTNTNCVNWYRNALKNWPDGKRPAKKAKVAVEETAEASTEEASTEEASTEEAVY